jgi:hypothetical protein
VETTGRDDEDGGQPSGHLRPRSGFDGAAFPGRDQLAGAIIVGDHIRTGRVAFNDRRAKGGGDASANGHDNVL